MMIPIRTMSDASETKNSNTKRKRMKKNLLLSVVLVMFAHARFWHDPITKTVIDTRTYLQWQDDYSDNGGEIKSSNWSDAIDYCENLSLNSHDDWRLPNLNELLTLVDYNKSSIVYPDAFETQSDDPYWSSSSNTKTYKYLVLFGSGHSASASDGSLYAVRCVRLGRSR